MAVQKFISDEAVKQLITNVKKGLDEKLDVSESHNPNLIDNWYFIDPVNQRGFTEIAGIGVKNFFDRWCSASTCESTLSLTNDGIKVLVNAKADSSVFIIYEFDKDIVDFLMGKTVTLSAIVESEKPYNISCRRGDAFPNGVFVYSSQTTGTGLVTNTTKIVKDYNSKKVESLRFTIFANDIDVGDTFTIKAAKLEIGDHQTLAHNEDGKWVLNDPPQNKSIELQKCQRYYQTASTGSVFQVKDGGLLYTCQFPVEMRAVPAVGLFKNSFTVSDGTTTYNITGAKISTKDVYKDGCKAVTLTCNFSGPVPSNGTILHYNDEGPIIGFDAELL